jgi:hypothetical protein
MPAGSPFEHGPHRLKLFIDNEDGSPALFASALPAIANAEDEESEYNEEPMLVSRAVQGLEILIYDEELEDWTEEWEKENAVPERILIKVYVASEDEKEAPIVFTRMLDIPVAKSVQEKLASPTNRRQNNPGGAGNPGGGKTIRVGGGNLPK